MAVLNENTIIGASGVSTGYEIDNSLRFNDDDSPYLNRTPSSAGNRQKFTYSCWIKRASGTIAGAGGYHALFSAPEYADEAHDILFFDLNNHTLRFDTNTLSRSSSAKHRDPSAWYHVVLAIDTTSASSLTAADRIKMWVNGDLIDSFSYNNGDPAIGYDFHINSAAVHYIGKFNASYLDGYLSEVNFIDGQALTPSDFGESGDYGEWKPVEYTGTYGTNGFYLDFKTAGTGTTGAGKDVSGEGNHWATSGIASTDQMVDTPTNNFCTLNPAWRGSYTGSGDVGVFSQGNLRHSYYNNNDCGSVATIQFSSGKWYWEWYVEAGGANGYDNRSGVVDLDTFTHSGNRSMLGATGTIVYAAWDQIVKKEATQTIDYGSTSHANGDVLMCAVDQDNGAIYFGKNGSWFGSGDPTSGSSRTGAGATWTTTSEFSNLAPCSAPAGGSAPIQILNFGQDSSFAGAKTAQSNSDSGGVGEFQYSVPSGFLALCTANLPDPTVIPSEHMNTLIWSGTGGSARSHTGLGFQPDMVWTKKRDTAYSHFLFDSVRGQGLRLHPNQNAVELDEVLAGKLSSFDSDGFSSTIGSSSYDNMNATGGTYVAWNWKGGGTKVLNENGTIDSQVSANADAGFSVVSYTGTGSLQTVGHGLSKAPEMILFKNRSLAGTEWNVFHEPMGVTNLIWLSLGQASNSTSGNEWNATLPSNTVFTVKTAGDVNRSGDDHIAYCFHSVDGYSKVGSYSGNGSTDGPFIYTGFKPAFVLVKQINDGNAWHIGDSVRDPYNLATRVLFPSNANAEQNATANAAKDFLSNGFKWRISDADSNSASSTYLYLAFAEQPFKHSNAR